MDDSRIIELYFERDEQAIAETKAKYGGRLMGLSIKILGNPSDCEECVSDTYMKAWNAIPPERPGRFFAYLAKICRNLCFGRLDYNMAQKRSARVIELSQELLECIPAEAQPEEYELMQGGDAMRIGTLLDDFLRRLHARQRVIFMRRYWFADSIAEIAERCGVSESNVKTTLFRARKKLREHLEQGGIKI